MVIAGKITSLFYDYSSKEFKISYVSDKQNGIIPIRQFDQPFLPLRNSAILIKCDKPYSPIIRVRSKNEEQPFVYSKFIAKRSIAFGRSFWSLYAVFHYPQRDEHIKVVNFELNCDPRTPKGLQKNIDIPIQIEVVFSKDKSRFEIKLVKESDAELIDSIIHWFIGNKLQNFITNHTIHNPNTALLIAYYQNIIDQISNSRNLNELKEINIRNLLTRIVIGFRRYYNADLFVKSKGILENLIKENYRHFNSERLLEAFFSFVELWSPKKSCGCIDLLNEDQYKIWAVFPLKEKQCICIVIISSEFNQQPDFRVIFFVEDYGLGSLIIELEKVRVAFNCSKAYIYSHFNYTRGLMEKGLEDTYLQFNCTLFTKPISCDPKCIVKRHEQDVITDYTNAIPKDHSVSNEKFYVPRNIVSDWKKHIGTKGLYGVFSIRKSGKSTSLKYGFGDATTLYLNLMGGKVNNDGIRFPPHISDYQYDIQTYLVESINLIYKGKKTLRDFNLVIIDEYEVLFKGLLDNNRGYEGRILSEKATGYIASLSESRPVILCGQDSTWYTKVLPGNNPLSSLYQLPLELFDLRDATELIKVIGNTNFSVDSLVIKNIYDATCGHPRILINILCQLIKFFARERMKKGFSLNMELLRSIFLKEGIENLFPLEKVMESLNQYTYSELEKAKADDFYSWVLCTFKIFGTKEKLKENVIIEASENYLSSEKIQILISTNLLSRDYLGNLSIKIPLLKDLYLKDNRIYQHLLKGNNYA